MKHYMRPISTQHNARCEDTYGATAAFAGDRWEIHRAPTGRADTEAILGLRRFRVRFREAMTTGSPNKRKNREQKDASNDSDGRDV